MFRWVVGIVVVAAAHHAATAAPHRSVRGVVVDQVTGEPVAGANVSSTAATVTTAVDGTFAIDVPAADTQLTITVAGYGVRTVNLDASDTLRIVLVPSTETIEVSGTAPRLKPRPRAPVAIQVSGNEPAAATTYQLTAHDLRTLPGTANDALRAAQVLPGVARLPFSFGGIVLRGAAPRDSVVFLDDIEVPLAFHFGGVTSFYPSGMLSDLTLKNSGLDADFGRASGGLISLTSRTPRVDQWRTGGSIGLLDSSVFAEGPIRSGGILLGLRRSYFDIVAAPFAADDTPMPSYWDMQIRSSFGDPRTHGRISPMMFFSLDYMTQTEPGRAMFENETELTSMFVRFAIPYERQWGATSLRIAPWFGTNQLAFRSRVNSITERFERPLFPGGVRSQLAHATSWGNVRGGVELAGGYLSHYQAGLGQSGDILVQMNGETDIDWLDTAAWADTRVAIDRLVIKPGVRVEHYGLTDENVIDPRLSLSVSLTETLTLRETIGRYHQPPTPGDVDPNGGNPSLKSSYSDSVSLGLDGELGYGWSGGLAGFYTRGSNLGVRIDNELMDFSRDLGGIGPTFSLLLEKQLGLAFYRENIGKAHNYGVELLLKKVTPQWMGLIAYTLSRAERHDGVVSGRRWRPFELDQRHNLNIAASRKLGKWRVGGRVHWVSGMPYSPVIGEDSEDRPIFDPYAARLPDFWQFDVRVDRVWPQCWGDIDLYFDIQNITNRRNVEGRQPDDFNETDVDIRGLPIMPFIGVEFIPR